MPKKTFDVGPFWKALTKNAFFGEGSPSNLFELAPKELLQKFSGWSAEKGCRKIIAKGGPFGW